MNAEDSNRIAEANAMPATLADLLMLEKRVHALEAARDINIEPPLTPEEARKALRLSRGVFTQWVDLGRLKVIPTSPKRFLVSQQSVRDCIAGGAR